MCNLFETFGPQDFSKDFRNKSKKISKKFQKKNWAGLIGWSDRPARLAGPLLLARFPRPLPVGAHIETFRHLHLWPQKPFPTSAPTIEDFKRLEGGDMGQRGKGESLWRRMEFSVSLRHLLGTS